MNSGTQRRSGASDSQVPARAVTATIVAALYWLTTCVAQILSPALPGWKSGIGDFIVQVERTAALLSQLALVAGCTFAFWMLIEILREGRIGLGFRVGAAPLAAAVVTTSLAASTRPLAALLNLGLSLMVGFLALAAAWTTARSAGTRGLGLSLGLIGLGAGLATLARLLALRASAEALTFMFTVSRTLATLSALLGVAAFAVGALWLAQRRWRTLALILGIPTGLAVVIAVAGNLGGASSIESPLVLLSRVTYEFGRSPYPLLPAVARQALDGALLIASAVVLVAGAGGGRGALGRAALSLALLPRSGTDIPLLALALALSSLIAPLCAAGTRATVATGTPPAAPPDRAD